MILTIIVPVFNIMQRKEFLLPTLRSVVNQTLYSQIKLLVVDDGSSDDTVSYVRSIQSQINFEFIPLPQNLGKHHLLNEIVQTKVGSPYLMILDSDDLLMPTAAEEMLNLFQDNSKLSCVKTAQAILSNNKIVYRSIAPLGPAFYKHYIHFFGAFIGNTGSIWKTDVFKKTIKKWQKSDELYPLSRMACEDSLRLYLVEPELRVFDAVDKPLFIYRLHANQWTASKENLMKCDELVYQQLRNKLTSDEIYISWNEIWRSKWAINKHTYNHLLMSLVIAWRRNDSPCFFHNIFKIIFAKLLVSPFYFIAIIHLVLILIIKKTPPHPYEYYYSLKWWWGRLLATDKKLTKKEAALMTQYLFTLSSPA